MARYGLIEAVKDGLRLFRTNGSTNHVTIAPPSSEPASNITVRMFSALPASTEMVTITSAGVLGTQAIAGGGTVTSVGLSAPALFSVSGSPVTASGTLALSFASQSANTFLAAPNGTAGTPTMRALVYADVSSFVGTTSSTLAAGNDSRFHTQNTDTGTTQVSFQLDSGNTGPRLKNVSGAVAARNAGDSANADFVAANVTVTGNLTVQGTTTTIESNTLTIGDNIIVLNNDVTSGTPTEDGGVQVRRGASTSAAVTWDETSDFWKVGLVGSELRVARHVVATFTNASLTAGIYTFNHALANQYPTIQIVDNNGKIIYPGDVTFTDSNNTAIDLTSFDTLTGTWRAVAVG